MGILSTIKDKLFGKKAAAAPAATPAPATTPAAATPAPAAAPAPAPAAPVDIEAIMEAAVKAKGIKLNWRVSIVDFMKALDLDSSLAARKELAADLNYKGTDPDGSAEKNIWLHKELMKILVESGGKLPKDIQRS
jgi:3-oxoacyl-ACP reductase-like protein